MFTLVRRLREACEILRLRRAARRNPVPRSVIRLCQALERHGRSDEALEFARRAAAHFPHSVEVKDLLSEALARRGDEQLTTLRHCAQVGRSPKAGEELVRVLLDRGDVADAVAAAGVLAKSFAGSARAQLMLGAASQARFEREHLSGDGRRALAALKRALELDSGCFDARKALAAAYAHIGATSQALFHLLLAIEQRSTDPDLRRMYHDLKGRPIERRAESDLLWEAEVNDQSRLDQRTVPGDAGQIEAMTSEVERLAMCAGVRRAVLCHHRLELVAERGQRPRRVDGRGDSRVNTAIAVRRAASTASKRMGLGGFHELDITLADRRVFVVAAGPTVLYLDLDPDRDATRLLEEARDDLGRWTADTRCALEFAR